MGKKLLAGVMVAGVAVAFVFLMEGTYKQSSLFAADNSDARYVMEKTGDGFLRLDKTTGHVSLCHPKATAWVCEAVADDRDVLEKEIARLEGRIGVLKRYIKKSKTSVFKLPSEEEVDQVMTYFEGLVKRFKGFADFLDDDEKVDDSI